MAKIVKKKNRRLSLEGFSFIFFSISLIIFLISSLFINTANNNLTVKLQKMNDELKSLNAQNQDLTFTIQSLENKDHVYEVAALNNLELNQDNIISISGD